MNTFFYKDIAYPDGVIGGKDYYNPVIYSTNERLIGVGENNKPLYQKTVTSNTLAAETSETILTGIDSLKVISLKTNNIYPFYVSLYNIGGSGTEYGSVELDNNNVIFFNNSCAHTVVIEAVLQYTKVTDTAGSAPYNNYGVPTVHYTTDEQVIGTWLGETLYRKVLDFSSSPITIPTNTWSKVDNMWKICPIRGTAIIPSSRATFEVAVDCDDNDGLYIRSWLAYSNVEYLIIEYTKTTT